MALRYLSRRHFRQRLQFHVYIGAMSGTPLSIALLPAASPMSRLFRRHIRRPLEHLQSRTLFGRHFRQRSRRSSGGDLGDLDGVSGGCLGGPRS